jgi:L-alanine-DL-glutamate epimerase-like enolase superfamily enzyme
MTRRDFLQDCVAGGLISLATPLLMRAQSSRRRELRITRILVQPAAGRRLTPVAPNAYAGYRGYERVESVLRIQTDQGLEGIGHSAVPAEMLRELLGRDPFELFAWTADGRIAGRAEEHASRLQRLGGVDVALLDLLGKALQRPSATLLGPAVRDSVPIYNSAVAGGESFPPREIPPTS